MKNLPLSLLGLIFILFATTASAQVASEQARNFQIDATHTGAITTQHLTPPLKQRWVVDFGQKISYPLIADGKVFVTVRNAGSGTTLFALDSTFGGLLWFFRSRRILTMVRDLLREWSRLCREWQWLDASL